MYLKALNERIWKRKRTIFVIDFKKKKKAKKKKKNF